MDSYDEYCNEPIVKDAERAFTIVVYNRNKRSMESELSGISNENQISWFGFSAISFSDSVFNIYADAWKEVCSKKFKGQLEKFNDRDRLTLLTFPFAHNSTEKAFQLMKRYCVSNVFRIPDSVTLPECKKMLMASTKTPISQKQAEKDFAAKLERIRELRIRLVQRRNEIDSINKAIEVLHEMEKSQEQLIKQKNFLPESPLRMSPV